MLTVDSPKNLTARFVLSNSNSTTQQPAHNDHPNGNKGPPGTTNPNGGNPARTLDANVGCGCNATPSSATGLASLILMAGLFGLVIARRRG
jgi:uncharacterized protein (TIGR03382 family)